MAFSEEYTHDPARLSSLGLSVDGIAKTAIPTIGNNVLGERFARCKTVRGRYAGTEGRTGKVSAGCIFWMKATQRTFTTTPEDHRNCSVGSLTPGRKTLAEAATSADVAALVESGWVTKDMFPRIPVIERRPAYITYGPLAEPPIEPDVVFMRLNAKQVMILHEALPELRFEGKPQCHIIPLAKEQNEVDEVAVNVGCVLSRVRTGMGNNEMTCALAGWHLR